MTTKKGGFQNEAWAVLLFLFGMVVAASLVMGGSLSPSGGGPVGWVGKNISWGLSYAFGVSSWLIAAGCVYFCFRFLFSAPARNDLLKDVAAFLGLAVSSALFAALALEGIFVNHLTSYGAGGIAGKFIMSFTVDSMGTFGSHLIALSAFTACAAFLSRTSLRSALELIFKAVKALSRAIKVVSAAVGAAAFKAAVFLVSRFYTAGKYLFFLIYRVVKERLEKRKEKPVIKKDKGPAVPPSPPVKIQKPEEKSPQAPPQIVVREEDKKQTASEIAGKNGEEKPRKRGFVLPPIDLLERPPAGKIEVDSQAAYEKARSIEEKLESFNVSGKVTEIRPGPVITMFEYKPAEGVRVSRIAQLEDDLAMSLSASSIRIISPIPGKDVVGIEVPNGEREPVCLREIIEHGDFSANKSLLTIAVGKDIAGKPYYTDLATAPHLMIAGTTGSGKSVLLNSLLASFFYKAGPDRLRLLMIDPKMLEFAIYENIPHLLHPIVTEPRKAVSALKWAVAEMENRYKILSQEGVRSIDSYNTKIEKTEGADSPKILPYIVILIDELADLMMTAAADTRDTIIRIAQKARAAGIHLVVATQRPSADVVSGLLKANIPARISFLVSTKTDSRVVLDANGAESLLGKGDMLFLKPGTSFLERIQGALITDDEREKIVDFLKTQGEPEFDGKVAEAINKAAEPENAGDGGDEEDDGMYPEALAIAREAGSVSISMLQRRLKIGYNRAATIVERMEREGIIGEPQGAGKPREVIAQAEDG